MIIFRYKWQPSLSLSSRVVELDDAKTEDNVHCSEGYITSPDSDNEENFFTVPSSAVEEIRKIIKACPDLHEIEGAHALNVLDGCDNDISVSSEEGELHTIRCVNLSSFRDPEYFSYVQHLPIAEERGTDFLEEQRKEYEDAQKVLEFFDEVTRILVSAGVPKKYFNLLD